MNISFLSLVDGPSVETRGNLSSLPCGEGQGGVSFTSYSRRSSRQFWTG